ncbi:MAG: rRNA maturation RNase YbeY [Eggerthellaceae bacterium]|jgi:probable rRNA maturation factor
MDVLVDYAYRPDALAGIPVEDVCRFVMEAQQLPENTEVSVSFVDDDTIARLNAEYRGKEGPTDVLSFELDGADTDEPEEFAGPDGTGADEPYELGDIVIAVDVAERQTQQYGTTFEEEVSLLLIHGVLHLCGYDHVTDEDAAVMEPLEKKLRAAWAEKRGLGELA